MLRKLAILSLLAILSGCATPAASAPASAAPVPTPAPTSAPTPFATPTEAPPTLPPGVAFVHDGLLEPGRYWFNGFQPWLQLDIDRPGWEVGHFHDQEFDLFLDGTFPSVGFARFPAVALPGVSASPAGSTADATTIDVILQAWRSNPNIVVTDVGEARVAGLIGRTVDVKVTAEQTALFGAASEAFKFDPGFDSRFSLLEVDGGVVEVFVVGQAGALEAAIQATRLIVDSLRTIE